jgi:hypothetical protein
MSRTPFLATTSLKIICEKVFRMFQHKFYQKDDAQPQLEAVKIQEEVDKLKTTLENDQKNNMEDLVNFKEMYENEKDRSNDLE